MKRVIYVKDKLAGYPSKWVLLNYDGDQFYLGNSFALIVSDAKQAIKAKKKAERQMGIQLFHKTMKVKEGRF